VVAADSRSPRNGRFIEIIGTYDPRQEPSVVKIDTEKAHDWIAKGAQPTETVARLIKVAESQPADDEAPAPAPAHKPEAPKPKAAPKADEAKAEEPKAEEQPAEEPAAEAAAEDAPEASADEDSSEA